MIVVGLKAAWMACWLLGLEVKRALVLLLLQMLVLVLPLDAAAAAVTVNPAGV